MDLLTEFFKAINSGNVGGLLFFLIVVMIIYIVYDFVTTRLIKKELDSIAKDVAEAKESLNDHEKSCKKDRKLMHDRLNKFGEGLAELRGKTTK